MKRPGPGQSYRLMTGLDNETGYRYGYNGKEMDFKFHDADGEIYNFGARLLDVRVPHFLSIDPLWNKYPNESPYNYVGNSPIVMIDIEGETKFTYIKTIAKDGTESLALKVETGKTIDKLDWKSPGGFLWNAFIGGGLFKLTGSKTLSDTRNFDIYQFVVVNEKTGTITSSEEMIGKERRSKFENMQEDAQTKQAAQEGGFTLISSMGVSVNDERFGPLAQNHENDVNVDLLFGSRGGAVITGNVGKLAEAVRSILGSEGVASGVNDLLNNNSQQAVGEGTHECPACGTTGDSLELVKKHHQGSEPVTGAK